MVVVLVIVSMVLFAVVGAVTGGDDMARVMVREGYG